MLPNTESVHLLALSMNALLDAEGFNFNTREVRQFVYHAQQTNDAPYYMYAMAEMMYPATGWDVPQTQSVDMAYDIFTASAVTLIQPDYPFLNYPAL